MTGSGGPAPPSWTSGSTCRFPISFCSGNRGAGQWKNVENPLLLQAKEPVPFWPAQPSWAQSMWKTIGFISKSPDQVKNHLFLLQKSPNQALLWQDPGFSSNFGGAPPWRRPKMTPQKEQGFLHVAIYSDIWTWIGEFRPGNQTIYAVFCVESEKRPQIA